MTAELKLISENAPIAANALRVGGVYRGILYGVNGPYDFVVGERFAGDVYTSGRNDEIRGLKIASAFLDNTGKVTRGVFAQFKEQYERETPRFEQLGTIIKDKDIAALCDVALPGSLVVVQTPHPYNKATRQLPIYAIGLNENCALQFKFRYGGKYYLLNEIELEVLHPERGVMRFRDGALVAPQQG